MLILFALAGALLALILSLFPFRSVSVVARIIVSLIAGGSAAALISGALLLTGMGASFGGASTSVDLVLLTSMWCAAGYFIYSGLSLWMPVSQRIQRSVVLANYTVMPVVIVATTFTTHEPEPLAGLFLKLFLGICYAAVWVRVYGTRTQHQFP